jgi:hypothetical protein
MSKYDSYRKPLPAKNYEPHPVWRGIGCFIMLILPIISYAISVLAVDYGIQQGIRLPQGLAGYPVMPDVLFKVPGLVNLLFWIQSQNNIYAYLLVAFFFLVISGGTLAFVYALMYRVTGPSQYSEFDAPPSNVKVKKYRR